MLYFGGYDDGMARYKDWSLEALERRLEQIEDAVHALRGKVGPRVQLYATGRKMALNELIEKRLDEKKMFLKRRYKNEHT